jgi:hypothetical protein
MTKVLSPQEFIRRNQQEIMQRFLNPKAGLPIATNNLGIAAKMLNGQIKKLSHDAAIIMPRGGVAKLYVATESDNYRNLFLSAFEEIGILFREPSLQFNVDHALAQSLAIGKFEYVLVNPVNPLANKSHGAFEKQSKDRVFQKTIEIASITEILKILEIAPAKRGNLLDDILVGITNAREAGIITKTQMDLMFETVRNSTNSLVSEAYKENKSNFEKAVSSD